MLEDGIRLSADLVVAGIGVMLRLYTAELADLTLNHGIILTNVSKRDAPGIYAAGDIARWPNPRTGEYIRVEHWALAQRQGQTEARNILGAFERFTAVPFF